MLEYKGYIGTVEYDPETEELFGKVVNSDALVMYNGDSVTTLRDRMREALDNYLALCEEQGIEPHKPFSGKIALRVEPTMHAHLAAIAESSGRSMNQVIVDALEAEVGVRLDENTVGYGRVVSPARGPQATKRGASTAAKA